jgi:hypothetical protein
MTGEIIIPVRRNYVRQVYTHCLVSCSLSENRRGMHYIITVFSMFILVYAQTPDTLWTRTYGSGFDDRGWSVQVTSDSGYIIGGYTYVAGGGGYNFYLVKTDPYGDTLWTKTYGGPSSDYGRSVRQTSDGGYVIVGYSYSFGGVRSDLYVVKTDSLGVMQWDKVYGDTLYDGGSDIQQTTDGGYIITGYTTPLVMGNEELWLLKLDSLGDTLWTRTYGTAGVDVGSAVVETADSGYVITGMNGYSLWILKTDRDGNLVWSKVYSPGNYAGSGSVQATSDGGFVVGGFTFAGAGNGDFWLLRTDSLGDTLWTRTYGGQAGEDGREAMETPEGGYIIVGHTFSFGAGWEDVYIVRTDSIGDTLWTGVYGGFGFDYGTSISLTPDGGYIVAGSTESFGAGGYDVWLLRIETDSYGVEEHECGSCVFEFVEVSPNPFYEQTQIRYEICDVGYAIRDIDMSIYDATGRLMKPFDLTSHITHHTSEVVWDGTDYAGRRLPSGVYFIKFEVGDCGTIEKVVLVR